METKLLDDNELIAAVVKAAICESRIHLESINYDPDVRSGGGGSVVIGLRGDVNGKLVLQGDAYLQAQKVLKLHATQDDIVAERAKLRAARKQIEALKDRLSRLHCISDPGCEDFDGE